MVFDSGRDYFNNECKIVFTTRFKLFSKMNGNRKIVPVFLSNGFEREVKTFVILNNWSEVTLIDEKLTKELRLYEPKTNLNLKWLNDSTRIERSSMNVSPIIYNVIK